MKEIKEFTPELIREKGNILYICAAGFEDRTRGIIESLQKNGDTVFKYSNILEYRSNLHSELREGGPEYLKKNKENLELLENTLKNLSENTLPNTIINIDDMLNTNNYLNKILQSIPSEEIDLIFIDISGMANFLILLSLHQLNKVFHNKKISILYTEAQNYFPEEGEKDEILQLAQRQSQDDVMKLAEILGASGARETLILPDFKGYFKEDFPICIIFFVGYEPSRAIGLLDTYRPHLVIACYGVSPHEHFRWRTEFSKELHRKLRVFDQYNSSSMEVSTFDIAEIISRLEEIYTSADREGKILYENYNIAVTPQCSKLQTVATYFFCQSHPDTQVVFCLPGTFNPRRYSKGIGKRWIYEFSIY